MQWKCSCCFWIRSHYESDCVGKQESSLDLQVVHQEAQQSEAEGKGWFFLFPFLWNSNTNSRSFISREAENFGMMRIFLSFTRTHSWLSSYLLDFHTCWLLNKDPTHTCWLQLWKNLNPIFVSALLLLLPSWTMTAVSVSTSWAARTLEKFGMCLFMLSMCFLSVR